MSYNTGIRRKGYKISKSEALDRVYLIKAMKNGKYGFSGRLSFPKSLIGLRVRLVPVREEGKGV